MRLIPIEEVVISPERQRKQMDPDKLMELMDSISNPVGGLIQLPVLSGKVLVAGERRYCAIKALYEQGKTICHGAEKIPCGMFPHTQFDELSDEEKFRLEFDENARREDLDWRDRARAEKRLVELFAKFRPANDLIDKFAEETSRSPDGVRASLAVVDNLHDPDVAGAASLKEATKIVRQKSAQSLRVALATGAAPITTPHKFVRGDAKELLKAEPSGKYDVIITDPPYGINAHKHANFQSPEKHRYLDTPEYAKELHMALAIEGLRITKPAAHLYLFHSILYFNTWARMFKDAGWRVWPVPLIWIKNKGRATQQDLGPLRTYEAIMYAIKGDRKMLAPGKDTIEIPIVEDKMHAAQKPVSLYTDLLSRSCMPGELVIDPFCGSGTIFPAANKLKLIATGFEISEVEAAAAETRIKEGL